MKQEIVKLIDQSSGIYSIPEIYTMLNAKLNEPYVSNQQIADIIQRDPGLTLSILKIVNSSFFGFPSTITSVNQALLILGRKELSTLLFSTSAVKVFNKLPIDKTVLYSHWRHSLLCGLLAKQLVEYCSCASDPDSLFIAGLLHDVGRLILWHQLPEKYEGMSKTIGEQVDDVIALELEIFGFTHAEVGTTLMRVWEVPFLLAATTEWHHNPDQADNYIVECQLINIANRLAHVEVINDQIVSLLESHSAWNTFSIAITELESIHSTSCRQLNDMIDFFIP